jgi:hypothetical protein
MSAGCDGLLSPHYGDVSEERALVIRDVLALNPGLTGHKYTSILAR